MARLGGFLAVFSDGWWVSSRLPTRFCVGDTLGPGLRISVGDVRIRPGLACVGVGPCGLGLWRGGFLAEPNAIEGCSDRDCDCGRVFA